MVRVLSFYNKKAILRIVMLMILILNVLFCSFTYSKEDLKNNSNRNPKISEHSFTTYRAITNISNTKYHNDQVMEEIIDKKTVVKKIDFIYSNNLFWEMFLTIIVSLLILVAIFKEWITKAPFIHNKNFLVHYLQLKDGKKDALSYC
jgi:hypothetical protein